MKVYTKLKSTWGNFLNFYSMWFQLLYCLACKVLSLWAIILSGAAEVSLGRKGFYSEKRRQKHHTTLVSYYFKSMVNFSCFSTVHYCMFPLKCKFLSSQSDKWTVIPGYVWPARHIFLVTDWLFWLQHHFWYCPVLHTLLDCYTKKVKAKFLQSFANFKWRRSNTHTHTHTQRNVSGPRPSHSHRFTSVQGGTRLNYYCYSVSFSQALHLLMIS